MGYRTAHLGYDLFRQSRIFNDLAGTDGVLIFTPLSRQELADPREEDKQYANELLKHLNDYLEHYHRAISVAYGRPAALACCWTASSPPTAADAALPPSSRTA